MNLVKTLVLLNCRTESGHTDIFTIFPHFFFVRLLSTFLSLLCSSCLASYLYVNRTLYIAATTVNVFFLPRGFVLLFASWFRAALLLSHLVKGLLRCYYLVEHELSQTMYEIIIIMHVACTYRFFPEIFWWSLFLSEISPCYFPGELRY